MENIKTTVETKNISLALANKMMEAAINKASELGIPFSIAIVDRPGNLKAFTAVDGAPVLSIEIAQNKAFSAAAYNRPTHEWYDRIKNDPPLLHGIVHTERLVIFGGGFPIKLNGELIGGIGVSGGHYTHDMQVCEAALEIIKDYE
ncbi:cobalamin adenosyltransferase [Bacillus sp. AFS076308]|uniref:GlcG/HbpS family heme-binding protein n=1 Tax=unclassified Bacillus (in: firmicutes) TaxID=185979 RepID=UPI000BF47538|nr:MULTISPECIES: heme-binding protein [unclassified Bacillus (in: firmicutes)]PFO05816.1 cobalamin adenosyltransferase [Bacillus sp. AFS076308]PGV54156.1 cobalamin adenosyltransferase [Bacillus sp. AFS037270]